MASDTDVDAPAAPPTRRRPLPLGPLLAGTLFSIAIALFGAWAFVKATTDDPTVRPDQLVGGQPRTDVDVEGTLEVGKPVPDVSFGYLDGSTGSLEEFRGTRTLVNFWNSTCAPCLREMPALEALHQSRQGELRVLGVDVTDSVEAGTRMVERTGVSYPIARDPKGEFTAAFGGAQLPHSVLLDADGTVIAVHDGAMDADELAEFVAR